jgi:Ca2+-binding EF-hand superfamily protein
MKDETEKHARELFKKYDKDNSGSIDMEELKKLVTN